MTRTYDSTIARMAGNIAPAVLMSHAVEYKSGTELLMAVAITSVAIARAIVAEVERTEPPSTATTTQTLRCTCGTSLVCQIHQGARTP